MLADLDALTRPAILVVGDAVLDEYLFGVATRLSREAPVPVLEFTRRFLLPGGAANPARNLAALGAPVALAAVVGADPDGAHLRDLLAAAGVVPRGLVADTARPTTRKTRILAEGLLRYPQQVARLDRLSRAPIAPMILADVQAALEAELARARAVLCSDYRAGLLTPGLVAWLRARCRARGVLLTVDAQGDLAKYRGVDLLRCNAQEAEQYLGRPVASDDECRAALGTMLTRLDVALVVVTRGRQGVVLQGRDVAYTQIPGRAVEVADTTGAGDTFIAVMTLALAGGHGAVEAATLANLAAGAVVQHVGNAVLSLAELRALLDEPSSR
ncbi:MAG TPA: bifunctional ADP-heptose synthase [Thermomicrobiales bacterium]|nr:bifunctional ADP-heptose synthase [Thermomicrobiales bacterium]